MAGRPRPFLLECEHEVWFRPEYAPSPGDPVLCSKCVCYQKVKDHDYTAATYYPDGEWLCYKVTNKTARGLCYRDGEGCGYEYKAPFKALRTRMERHHIRGCDKDEIEVGTILLPPNSPPPF